MKSSLARSLGELYAYIGLLTTNHSSAVPPASTFPMTTTNLHSRSDHPWFHPVYGYTETERAASVEADADRKWQSHVTNPASHWIYVTEESSEEVIGVAEWIINVENPYPNGPVKLECTWFPEGETRDFVTELMNQCFCPRMNWMDRPHIGKCLQIRYS
jgi:hypothetical protein